MSNGFSALLISMSFLSENTQKDGKINSRYRFFLLYLHFNLSKFVNMKKINCLAASAFVGAAAIFTSCGMGTAGNMLGASSQVAPAATNTTTTTTQSSGQSSLLGGLIGNVIGSIVGNNESSIVGTWVYTGPSVAFESENLLAKAGGAVAAQSVASKVEPYYEKVGITSGSIVLKFNQDKTCSFSIKGKEHQGTYEYDPKDGTLKVSGSIGILKFPKCNASIKLNQMSLTFQTNYILSAIGFLGSSSQNSTLQTIGTISKQYDGMQTGLQFKKQ